MAFPMFLKVHSYRRKSAETLRFRPAAQATEKLPNEATGGGSGIRTHDTRLRIHALQACAFNRSAIPPGAGTRARRPGGANYPSPTAAATVLRPFRNQSQARAPDLEGVQFSSQRRIRLRHRQQYRPLRRRQPDGQQHHAGHGVAALPAAGHRERQQKKGDCPLSICNQTVRASCPRAIGADRIRVLNRSTDRRNIWETK